ncbi:Crinkler (CRN) family protein [Mycena indigotica]|uniref:Crinkler (CRN) family protein n=1 Tax=Mycena indigotica TaxID=2126181 RepID=A0A8H6SMA5_9AGAR|nr:Crinkler (CRN) family protein [Mycena indigotica]KAF7302016.1 Crinkler (CRN) family protein [Mycena indigotica]
MLLSAPFNALHQRLWPQSSNDPPASDLNPLIEPPQLTKLVKTTPILADGGRPVRYIDLRAAPELAIGELEIPLLIHANNDCAAVPFVVQDEYLLLAGHIFAQVRSETPVGTRRLWNSFFVTGHQGIGKSFFAYYLLFRLLALGQAVIFCSSVHEPAYLFDSNGARPTALAPQSKAAEEVLEGCWVILDIDDAKEWEPPSKLATLAQCIVWTSPPYEERERHFRKRFGSQTWFMRTWDEWEIMAVSNQLSLDKTILERTARLAGPVPRALWGIQMQQYDASYELTLDSAIGAVLSHWQKTNAFDARYLRPEDVYSRYDAVLRLEPRPDKNTQASQRRNFSVHFVSPYVAQRALALITRLHAVAPQLFGERLLRMVESLQPE